MRYLLGPVPSAFAIESLLGLRQSGQALCLGLDIPFAPTDDLPTIVGRLPGGWRPDRVVVWLDEGRTPVGLWHAPVPVIGVATDWDIHPHLHRHAMPLCDVVLADAVGTRVLSALGPTPVRFAELSGLGDRAAVAADPIDAGRDIDVLVLDRLDPAARRERLPWVGRLAHLNGTARVVVRPPTTPEADRGWLARARLFVQLPPACGDENCAYEAVAAGAVLVRPARPGEPGEGLRPDIDFVAYDALSFEGQIAGLLARPERQREIVAAGQARVRGLTAARRFEGAMASLDRFADELLAQAARRVEFGSGPGLGWFAWAAVSAGRPLRLSPEASEDTAEVAAVRGVVAPDAAAAVEQFRAALQRDPHHPVVAANLAAALAAAGRPAEAVPAARAALGVLDRTPAHAFSAWDLPLYAPAEPLANAEWERAIWAGLGDPAQEAEAKRATLRWRLHSLLAAATDDLSHFHEAALARPDLPVARAAVGCALARRGRVVEAMPHLRAAGADPLDRAAARALDSALLEVGDAAGTRLFRRSQRRLALACGDACPVEAWFAEATPVGDELASVVVVIHDQLELTRLCLEGVLRHTRPPYELILVDNGSSPETAAALVEMARRPGAVRVGVVTTGSNLGYPAAANRGVGEATGEFVVFLNNDALVTPGWLDGLIRHALADWPGVGLVGPVSNCVPEPQRVAVGYRELDGLDDFALARLRAHAGRSRAVDRLSGFCVLAHRDVIRAVGPLDEHFGAGFFDDDDFGLRVRRTGRRLVVATDVYVHHFGSATFRALDIDTAQLLSENHAKFRVKWGDAEADRYAVPATHAASSARPRVSLCMIVRDEERHLPGCLASVIDLVDEVVVVDTGSTDRTREIAATFGAKVKLVEFPWVDHFAEARNVSLDHATGDWVLWMDADDRVEPGERAKLRALFASLGGEADAYVLKCRCVAPPPSGAVTVVDHVRLFRNDPRLRWRYRVHEQILPALRDLNMTVRWADPSVTHIGYADASARAGKLERDLRLLRIEEAERPDDPFTLFNLGSVLLETGAAGEALRLLERSIQGSHPTDSIVRKLYAQVAECHRRSGRPAEALAACVRGRELYQDDAELLSLEGGLRQEAGDWAGAAACWGRLVLGRDAEHFASVDSDLRGTGARHNLAIACLRLARYDEAERHWRAALAADPASPAALTGLGEIAVHLGDDALLAFAVLGLAGLNDPSATAAADRLRRRFDESQRRAIPVT